VSASTAHRGEWHPPGSDHEPYRDSWRNECHGVGRHPALCRPMAHICAAHSDTRDVARGNAENSADTGVTCHNTQSASAQRQHHTFGKQLPHNPPAPGAHGRANRDFSFPARRARQQQVGHIRTRDQQHQPDRHHLSHMKFLEEQIVEIDDDIKATIHEMGMDREWELVQTVPGLP
jgi:hypothetical protein